MSVKTAVGCSGKSPRWDLSCDDDVWLHEQATMNRAQNSFVFEQLAQIQSAHDELHHHFADHETMQIRPATTHDLTAESRICLLDLRNTPNHEFDAIRQYRENMQPDMLIAVVRTKVVISCSICAVAQRNRIRHGTPAWVSGLICLDSSDRSLKQERISIFTSIPRDELRKLRWNLPSHDSNELDRSDGGTVLSSPRGQRRCLEH